jgi:hypothetical protein
MRTFIDGNGNDSSIVAREYLATHRQLTLPDLYVINTAPSLPLGPPAAPDDPCGTLSGGGSSGGDGRPPGVYGPFNSFFEGNDYSGNERGYLKPATGLSGTSIMYFVEDVTNLGAGYGPFGLSDYFSVVITAVLPDLTVKSITVNPVPGTYLDSPTGFLLPNGSGGLYLGHQSGYDKWRWHLISIDESGTDWTGTVEAFAGSLALLFQCDGDGYAFPLEAVTAGNTLLHITADGSLTTFGPGTTDANIYPVVSGLECDLVTHSTCSCFPHLNTASLGTMAIGAINGAAAIATSDTEVWILSQSGTEATLSRVDVGSGIVAEYVVLGTGASSPVLSISYLASDNTLLFWIGNTLYKWSIASASLVASTAMTFAGSGPIQSGLLPNGLDLVDPTTLTVAYSLKYLMPGYMPWGYPFKYWYDANNYCIWLQDQVRQVWCVQGAIVFAISARPSSLSIPQGHDADTTITVTTGLGFDCDVELSVAGVPANVTVGFTPSTVPAPGAGESIMAFTVAGNAAVGTYYLTVTAAAVGDPANGGGLFQYITVVLTVTVDPAKWPLGKRFLLTEYPSSLVWDYKGKFLPAVISRGEVESKIGLEADTVAITWSPKDSDVLGDGEISALAAFGFGLFDNGTVEVWRCVMPRPGDLVGSPEEPAKLGDCNTFGATLMFSGRIGDLTPDRAKVVMTVLSRMETLNVEVPTNIIEPTNVFAYCGVGQIPTGGAPSFNVSAGSTALVVYGDPATDEDLYDGGYLVFGEGSNLCGVHARILLQSVVEGHNAFYLSEALPFAPTPGDTVVGYVGLPLDASGSPYGGYRWAPSPDNSAVII